MRAGVLSDIAVLFDEIIEDILADALGEGEVGPQDAVDLAEIVYAVNVARHAEGRPRVTLPLTVERQLLECAKLGMHKGKGNNGRPRDSQAVKLLKDGIVIWANDRKQELLAQGMKQGMTKKAAQGAEDLASKLYGNGVTRAVGTLITKMHSSDDELLWY